MTTENFVEFEESYGNLYSDAYQSLSTVNSGNFRGNFIFANSVKRHISDVKNSQPGHDLPVSVNGSHLAISRVLFSRNFAYAKFRENKILAQISEFTGVYLSNTPETFMSSFELRFLAQVFSLDLWSFISVN